MAVSARLRFKILVRDAFTCRYCGRSAPDVVLHVDHVHPVSRGGADDESNLVAACRECNASKGGRLLPIAIQPASGDAGERTYPHPDACATCRDLRLYAAEREEPGRIAGYFVAWYACRRGHSWRTCWANPNRLTAAEVRTIVASPARDCTLVGAGVAR